MRHYGERDDGFRSHAAAHEAKPAILTGIADAGCM